MPGEDEGAALVGRVGPRRVQQPPIWRQAGGQPSQGVSGALRPSLRTADNQIASSHGNVDGVRMVCKDRRVQVIERLDLCLVSVGEQVVERVAAQVGARHLCTPRCN